MGGMNMYTIERSEKAIKVDEYIEGYVNVEEFLEYCKECRNYEAVWSCPSYDFDPEDYWKEYDEFLVVARKIIFGPDVDVERSFEIMHEVKNDMSLELYELEKEYPGSISLSAGSCSMCKEGCIRTEGLPCRYPDKMRYSIESLGGNVGKTVSKLMGYELEWVEEGKLPSYFVLVGGLLKK
jgi:predicted metal-binding protein